MHTGQVVVEDIVRNDSATFIRFLRMLDRSIDPKLTTHLVLDNESSHVSKATRAWLAAHPGFAVHHTPKHASWLNQVEIFFSILARRLLRRGEFTSRQDQIREFTLAHDDEARAFRWTYDGAGFVFVCRVGQSADGRKVKVSGSTGRFCLGRPATTSRYDSVTRSSTNACPISAPGLTVIQCFLFMW